MQSDETKAHFNRLYKEVSDSLAAAKSEVAALRVDHAEGKREIGGMLEKLQEIQGRFDSELSLLAQHAEWDRFTIAFFGETNAGKSTLIEALRILFKEESRQQLLAENARDLTKYDDALKLRIQHVAEAFKVAYAAHAKEMNGIKAQVAMLSKILDDETTARNQIVAKEAQARTDLIAQEAQDRTRILLQESQNRQQIIEQDTKKQQQILEQDAKKQQQILEQESQKRQQILEQESSARVRLKMVLVGLACGVCGAAMAAAATILVGR